VLYTTTMFWYLAENQKDSYTKMPIEDRVGYPRILSEFGVPNCIEGEDMKIIGCTGGQTTSLYVEGLHTGGWSGKRGKQQLWWNRINPGDTLTLAMPVETEAEYKLRIQFIKGIGYGNFKICMDDRPIDESLDLSNPELSPSDLLDFGLHKLNKGTHTLMIVALNKPTNSDGLQFGLDYIQLEPWDGTRGSQLKKHHVVAGDFTNFFNQFNINDHCFIQDNDGIWHFYGIGGRRGFAHGTSDNLRNIGWKQADYPFPVEWDPWKEMHLWAPHIIKHNDLYYMFYCAGGKTGATYRMHLATSADHQNWTRHEENPLFIDGFDARDPMVLKVGDVWVMYYCANTDPRGGNHVVAYRLSKDLVHWGERNIAFIDPRIHKSGGGTESPFVVRRGDMYYLFIGPREGYVGTDIFASKNPFQWHLEDRVGHINSHAAEVVRDKDGKWYVSHSGVGEGGLYLAPIFWNDGLDEADSSIPIPERKN
jgi:beta-fructofuranosidase